MISANIGINDFINSIDKTIENIDDYLLDGLKECGEIIVDESKKEFLKHFKMRSGRALNSISILHVDNDSVEVGLDGSTEYAEYLHNGSVTHSVEPVTKKALNFDGNKFSKGHVVSGIDGVPFMEIGIKNSENKCVNLLDKKVNEAIKDAGI